MSYLLELGASVSAIVHDLFFLEDFKVIYVKGSD